MNNVPKRDRLVDSAAFLFHHNGLSATSLADIAKHADIPIGNVYYYFKTKEELALAAVSKRKEQFAAAYSLLEDSIADPRLRLIESIRFFDKVKEEYTRFGCPVAKIVQDADIEKDNVAKIAGQVFAEFVEWAARQFRLLGHNDVAQALAITLLSGIQGAILVAKAYSDPAIITNEINRLVAWLESLPNKRIQLGKVGPRGGGDNQNAA